MIRCLLILLILACSGVYGQCPFINLGPDITLPCAQNCTTATASFFPTYESNTYTVSSIPYNPLPYNFGTLYSIPIDDRFSDIINLPFNFCYMNSVYNQCVVSTNGFITFNLAYANAFSPWAFSAAIPTTAPNFPRSMIGMYHDIDPSVGGEVRYGVYGSFPCRRFVVNFYNIPHFACNIPISTFQIVLYELTNVIEVHIFKKQTCNMWNGGRACLGIQNDAGTLAFTPPGRNTSVYTINTPEAWRFSPSGAPTYNFNWLNTNNTNPQYNHCYQSDSTLIGRISYNICGGGQYVIYDTLNVSPEQNTFGLGISVN